MKLATHQFTNIVIMKVREFQLRLAGQHLMMFKADLNYDDWA